METRDPKLLFEERVKRMDDAIGMRKGTGSLSRRFSHR